MSDEQPAEGGLTGPDLVRAALAQARAAARAKGISPGQPAARGPEAGGAVRLGRGRP